MPRNKLLVGEEWNDRIDVYSEMLRQNGQERFDRLLAQAGGEGAIREREIADLFASAYRTGGRSAGVVADSFFDFDPSHPRVVKWAESNAAELIKGIDEETRDVVKVLLREGIFNGTPEDVMRGRIQNFVGLDPRRARAVANFSSRQIQNGVPPGVVYKNAQAYAQRLRADRADAILRTELQMAMEQGKLEFWMQAAEAGLIRKGDTWRIWVTHEDERLCPSCRPMDGKRARLGGSFHGVLGKIVAPPYHIRCRCFTVLEAPLIRTAPVIKHGNSHDEKDHGNWARGGQTSMLDDPPDPLPYDAPSRYGKVKPLDDGSLSKGYYRFTVPLKGNPGNHIWAMSASVPGENFARIEVEGWSPVVQKSGLWASLSWAPKTGEIVHIYVDPLMRRQGVGVAMLEMAKRYTPGIKHSKALTPDGFEWATSPAAVKIAPHPLEKHGSGSHDDDTHGNWASGERVLPEPEDWMRKWPRSTNDTIKTKIKFVGNNKLRSGAAAEIEADVRAAIDMVDSAGLILPNDGFDVIPVTGTEMRKFSQHGWTPNAAVVGRRLYVSQSWKSNQYAIARNRTETVIHEIGHLLARNSPPTVSREYSRLAGVDPHERFAEGFLALVTGRADQKTIDELTGALTVWSSSITKHGSGSHDDDDHGNWAQRGYETKGRVSYRVLREFANEVDNSTGLDELKEDIAENDILDPLEIGWHFGTDSPEIEDGHHRVAVAGMLGLYDLPVRVARNVGPDIESKVRHWLNEVDEEGGFWIDDDDVSKHGSGSHDDDDHGNWADGQQKGDEQKERAAPGVDRPSKMEPGTRPIPEGYVRLYHYSTPEGLEGIITHGLQRTRAKGDTYGEPNMIWASTRKPREDSSFVEFAVPFDDVVHDNWRNPSHLRPVVGAPYLSDKYTAEKWMEGWHDIGFGIDTIPTSAFVQVNRPSDNYYRALYLDESYRKEILADPKAFDWLKGMDKDTDRVITMAAEDIISEGTAKVPVTKHASPIHPGTGTGQDVHAGGDTPSPRRLSGDEVDAKVAELQQRLEEDPRYRDLGSEGFTESCPRCGGAGGRPEWPMWTCFKCGGSGVTYRKWATLRDRARREIRAEDPEYQEAKAEERMEQRSANEQRFINDNPEFFEAMDRWKKGDFSEDGFLDSVLRQAQAKGQLSDRQLAALGPAISRFDDRVEQMAEQAARRALIPEFKTGKQTVSGKIVSSKYQDSMYGSTLKMLVELEDGNRVWGTAPASIVRSAEERMDLEDMDFFDAMKGATVEFTAEFERSNDDEHFGFFKRPSKARWKDNIEKFKMRYNLSKHPGPDGGPIHSTGTDQSVHAGVGGASRASLRSRFTGPTISGEAQQHDLVSLNEHRLRGLNRPGIDDNPEIVAAARQLFEKGLEREIIITNALQDSLGRTGEFHGFTERVKLEGSIRDKLYRLMTLEGFTLEEAMAEKVKDLNRYTITWSDEGDEYANGVLSAVDAMRTQGWSVESAKDAWRERDLYLGHNTRFEKDGIIVEVQFHTYESAEAKLRSHVHYMKARTLPKDHPDYVKATFAVRRIWESVKIPKLPDFGIPTSFGMMQ